MTARQPDGFLGRMRRSWIVRRLAAALRSNLATWALAALLGATGCALFLAGRSGALNAAATALLAALAILAAAVVFLALRSTRALARQAAPPDSTADLARVLLSNLMTHFPGHVYFKDRESRFIRISTALARHFGLKHEAEALGKTDFDMFAGEHARQAMADEQEIMRTGKPRLNFEEKETWTDGRVAWASSSKLPLRDEQGNVVGTFGVSLDITARKRAEQALTDSEAFFDSLINSLPQNIFCKDLEGRFTFGNRAFCDTGRRSLDDLLGKTDFEIAATPELAKKYREEDERVMRTGQTLETIEQAVGMDGQIHYRHLIKTPRYDAARQIVGLQGIFWDVTPRQRAEQELMHERDLLRALMDNIPEPIFFKNASGRYTRVNLAQAQLLGLVRPEEAVGRGQLEPDEADIIGTGVPLVSHVERTSAPDGTTRWMLTTKVPIRGQSSDVTGLVGMARDVTEGKLAEEALDRGLATFLDLARQVASGDLTRRAAEGDDTLGRIGRSMNTMLDNFAAALRRARDAALSVASAAGQILASARQIAQGAQRQTDEVNSTSTAVEEMAASMSQVSKNAEDSANAAQGAQGQVEQGDRAVSDTFGAMTRIDETARSSAEKMRTLERRSTEISDVIELIDDVAAQTKLLSLNAAIEAAHAGEAGLGFNVVAEEIRKLADRTARATKDVSALIEAVQGEIGQALAAMEREVQEVGQGRTLAEQARQTLREIASAAQRSAELSRDISNASREQADVTRELVRAMQTIANITVESSSGAQETAHTVQDLVTMADQLTAALAHFKVPTGH